MSPKASTSTAASPSDRIRQLWLPFAKSTTKSRSVIDHKVKAVLDRADKDYASKRQRQLSPEQHSASKARLAKQTLAPHFEVVRAQWERTLTGSGLRLEDWTDMSPEEMLAVSNVLGNLEEEGEEAEDDDDDDDESELDDKPAATAALVVAPSLSASTRSSNVSIASSYAFVDPSEFHSEDEDYFPPIAHDLTSDDDDAARHAFDAWSSDSSSRSLFSRPPLTSASAALHQQTPTRKSTSASRQATLGSRLPPLNNNHNTTTTNNNNGPKPKPARQCYVGPIIANGDYSSSDDDDDDEEDFEQFKMTVQIQTIVEFHQAAARADVELALAMYKDRKKLSSSTSSKSVNGTGQVKVNGESAVVSSRLAEHHDRMARLQLEKEEERRRAVAAERTRRRSSSSSQSAPSPPGSPSSSSSANAARNQNDTNGNNGRNRQGRSGTLIAPKPSAPPGCPAWLTGPEDEDDHRGVEQSLSLERVLGGVVEGDVERVLQRMYDAPPGGGGGGGFQHQHHPPGFLHNDGWSSAPVPSGSGTAAIGQGMINVRNLHNQNQNQKSSSPRRKVVNNNNNTNGRVNQRPTLFGDDSDEDEEDGEGEGEDEEVNVNGEDHGNVSPPAPANLFMDSDASEFVTSQLMASDPDLVAAFARWGGGGGGGGGGGADPMMTTTTGPGSWGMGGGRFGQALDVGDPAPSASSVVDSFVPSNSFRPTTTTAAAAAAAKAMTGPPPPWGSRMGSRPIVQTPTMDNPNPSPWGLGLGARPDVRSTPGVPLVAGAGAGGRRKPSFSTTSAPTSALAYSTPTSTSMSAPHTRPPSSSAMQMQTGAFGPFAGAMGVGVVGDERTEHLPHPLLKRGPASSSPSSLLAAMAGSSSRPTTSPLGVSASKKTAKGNANGPSSSSTETVPQPPNGVGVEGGSGPGRGRGSAPPLQAPAAAPPPANTGGSNKKLSKKQRQVQKKAAAAPAPATASNDDGQSNAPVEVEVPALVDPPLGVVPQAINGLARLRKDSFSAWGGEMASTPRPASKIPAHLLKSAAAAAPLEQLSSHLANGGGSSTSTIKAPSSSSSKGGGASGRSAWSIFAPSKQEDDVGPSKVQKTTATPTFVGKRDPSLPGGFSVDDDDDDDDNNHGPLPPPAAARFSALGNRSSLASSTPVTHNKRPSPAASVISPNGISSGLKGKAASTSPQQQQQQQAFVAASSAANTKKGKNNNNKRGGTNYNSNSNNRKTVTMEELPDDEGQDDGYRGERLPLDSRFILEEQHQDGVQQINNNNNIHEPKPSVPPTTYEGIIGYEGADDAAAAEGGVGIGRRRTGGGGFPTSAFAMPPDHQHQHQHPQHHPHRHHHHQQQHQQDPMSIFDGDPVRFAAALKQLQADSARIENELRGKTVWDAAAGAASGGAVMMSTGMGTGASAMSRAPTASSLSGASGSDGGPPPPPAFLSWGQPPNGGDRRRLVVPENGGANDNNNNNNNLNNNHNTQAASIPKSAAIQSLKRSNKATAGGQLF